MYSHSWEQYGAILCGQLQIHAARAGLSLRSVPVFGNLKKRIKGRFNPDPIDPSQFNDPVALRAEWEPIEQVGAVGWAATHKAIKQSSDRVVFVPTGRIKLLLFLMPLILAGFGLGVCLFKQASLEMSIFIAGICATPALPISVFLRWRYATPIVFDKTLGWFWKGRKSPDEVFDVASIKTCVALKEICAIQLLSDFALGGSQGGSGWHYELNVVLHDGSRHNVVGHCGKRSLQEDAQTLATFLGVPVWDAINDEDG